MDKVVIVVPVYKTLMSENERKSFLQLLKVLGNYDIICVAPKSLDIHNYQEFAEKYNLSIGVERFQDYFFKSVFSYNDLLMSLEFYEAFIKYDYLLIYQLDAYVFSDQLQEWVKKGYDYIGAPLFDESKNHFKEYSGNGGFSLRKVQSHYKALKKLNKGESLIQLMKQYRENFSTVGFICRLPMVFIRGVFNYKNDLKYFTKDYGRNEDVFWFETVPVKVCKEFRVAPFEESRNFAFEKRPKQLYQLNNQNLPFGCHAWDKYGLDFWNSFI